MNRPLKVTLNILVTFILLIMLLATVITHFVDPNSFKPTIESKFFQATGRTLNIQGKLAWSLFPNISIETGKMLLENPKDFGGAYFAKIDKASISLKLIPILSGTVDLNNITLDGLSVHLIKNKHGQTNWAMKPTISKTTDPMDELDNQLNTNASPQKQDFSFGNIPNINIKKVNLTWSDEQTGQSLMLKNLSLKMKQISMHKAFPLEMSFDFESRKPPFTAHLALESEVMLDLDAQYYQLKHMTLTLNKFKTTANLTIDQSTAEINGQLDIPPFDFRDFLESIGQTLPPSKNKDTFRKVGGSLELEATHNTARLKNVKLILDKSQLIADVDINNIKQKRGTFNIHLNQINVDDYLPENTASRKPSTTTKKKSVTLSKKTSLVTQIDGQITADKIQAYNLQVQNLLLNIRIRDNVLNIDTLTADLYKGKLNSKARINTEKDNPVYQTDINLSNVALEPLGHDLAAHSQTYAPLKKISGTASFNASIKTQGQTPGAIKQHLNGKANVEIRNGLLKGVDFAYYLKMAQAFIRGDNSGVTQSGANETEFGDLTASTNIVNGVVNNNDLLMQSPALKVTGEGYANLAQENIDYDLLLTPQRSHTQNGTRVHEDTGASFPVTVTGNLNGPDVSLDKTALLKRITKKQGKKIQEQLKDKAKDLLKGIRF